MTAQENLKNNFVRIEEEGFTYWISKSLLEFLRPKNIPEIPLESYRLIFLDEDGNN